VNAHASAAERQFWLAEQLAPGCHANVSYARIRLAGPVDAGLLRAAVRAVMRRHPALRTRFVPTGRDLLRQVRAEPVVRDVVVCAPDADVAIAAGAMGLPFRLADADVLALAVVPVSNGADLYLGVHHAVFDGASQEIFTADLATAYGRLLAGDAVELPEVARAGGHPADDVAPALLERWRELLAGVPDLPGDPIDRRDLARAAVVQREARISARTVRGATRTARAAAVSPATVLFDAYARALAATCGAADFCIGVPVVTRRPGQDREIGCEVNTVPVRVRPARGLAASWAALVASVELARVPLADIVRAARTGAGRRQPLFQAIFAHQSWQRPLHEAGPARLRTMAGVRPLGLNAEVQLQLCDRPDGSIEAVLQAPADGFWAARIDELWCQVHRCLEGVPVP
jgi:hypothetical protein